LSIHIPQINVNQSGELIPNPGENIISLYKPVEHDKHEGELYVTDSRIVWVGTKAKGSFLGKIAKAAVMVAAMGGGAYAGGMGGRRMGMGPMMGGIGGFGGGMGGLGMTHMVSKNQQGQPQTVSLPYQVISDVQVGSDQKVLVAETQAGSITFKFEHGGDANAIATVVKTQKLEAQRRSSTLPPQNQQSSNYREAPPPQYVAPPPRSQGYYYCPHCGTPVESGSEYCHNCGGRIQ
jgi:hypothetical protein